MFARMLHADGCAIVPEHFAIERARKSKLLGNRRPFFAPAARKITRKLTGKPRPPLRATSDHQRVGTGRGERHVSIVEAFDVAVDDDWDRYRVFDLTHGRPVGAAFVELTAGA